MLPFNQVYNWNRKIHYNIPIDQTVDLATINSPRDVPDELSEQIGAGLKSRHGHSYGNVDLDEVLDDVNAQFGAGPVNWVINHLPVELHLRDSEKKLKYHYCGPGTKLAMRLKRGDAGINELDRACKEHDIAYRDNRTAEARAPADTKLAEVAQRIAGDPTASKDERAKANLVASIMHGKVWLGAGIGGDDDSSILKAVGSVVNFLWQRQKDGMAKTAASKQDQVVPTAIPIPAKMIVPARYRDRPDLVKWHLDRGYSLE